jgi:hypothetical protein
VSTTPRTELNLAAPPAAALIQRRSLWVGMIFGIASILGAIFTPAQAMHSYLLAYMWWLEMTLGCLALLMTQFLTGGSWGMVLRRFFEAGSRCWWLMALFFIPIVIGMHDLYFWTDRAKVAEEGLQKQAAMYLTAPDFVLRGAIYFVGWGVAAYFLTRWSGMQDQPPDREFGSRFRGVSGPGIVVYFFTMSFASVDWVMSLQAHWVSTIYGMIFVAGQGLAGICLAAVMAIIMAKYEPMRRILKPSNLNDYGNLMLTFIMLWGWFTFSQWLIIWAGNLPDEISWYLVRLHHGWRYVGFCLLMFYFVFPFLLLLSKNFKRNPKTLVWLAVWMIIMRWTDLFWQIEPAFNRDAFHISWLDFVIPIAIGGFWVWLFYRNLRSRPLVPLHDPRARAILGPDLD